MHCSKQPNYTYIDLDLITLKINEIYYLILDCKSHLENDLNKKLPMLLTKLVESLFSNDSILC